MIKVQKQKQNNQPIAVIRAASGNELTNYEKKKLAGIEEQAQQNKIEVIRVRDKDNLANCQKVQIDQYNKTAYIDLGNLAFKSAVTSNELDADELFFIKCELDDAVLIDGNGNVF